jgi:hypothetical protein
LGEQKLIFADLLNGKTPLHDLKTKHIIVLTRLASSEKEFLEILGAKNADNWYYTAVCGAMLNPNISDDCIYNSLKPCSEYVDFLVLVTNMARRSFQIYERIRKLDPLVEGGPFERALMLDLSDDECSDAFKTSPIRDPTVARHLVGLLICKRRSARLFCLFDPNSTGFVFPFLVNAPVIDDMEVFEHFRDYMLREKFGINCIDQFSPRIQSLAAKSVLEVAICQIPRTSMLFTVNPEWNCILAEQMIADAIKSGSLGYRATFMNFVSVRQSDASYLGRWLRCLVQDLPDLDRSNLNRSVCGLRPNPGTLLELLNLALEPGH